MDEADRRAFARCRVLALRAMMSAGGVPRLSQVRRALDAAATLAAAGERAGSESAGTVVSEAESRRKRRRERSRVHERF